MNSSCNCDTGTACACGCCEGIAIAVPQPTANRPGLPALAYRVGTYATFLETMIARLSSQDFPALAALTTRAATDPSVALLDSWAVVADVLMFYQERIANEGYLRTAAERRSILELARLIGYRLRPGVAASVYLAFTLDEDNSKTLPIPTETIIPAGSLSQSVPGPGELPQSFETSDDLDARSEWNDLGPRIAKPQNITLASAQLITKIYLAGTGLNFKPNDRILLVFGDEPGEKVMRRILEATDQFTTNQTEATLHPVPFLVIAAVELLRTAKTALDSQIQLARSAGASDPLIPQMESISDVVQMALDTLVLDNYPPIDEAYLNHDRIYGLQTDGTGLARLMAAVPTAKLSRPASAKRSSKKAQKAAAAAQSESFWQSADFLAVGGAVLSQLLQILKNATFREELTRLLISVVGQARPTNTQDWATISRLLDSGLVERYMELLTSAWKTLQALPEYNSVQPTVLAVLAEFTRILSTPELRTGLISLASDLPPAAKRGFGALLKNALAWLEALPEGPHIERDPSPVRTSLEDLVSPLTKPPSAHPANSAQLARNISTSFGKGTDAIPQLLVAWHPELSETLYTALSNADVNHALSPLQSVHILRLVAAPFGYNAPVKMGLAKNQDTETNSQIPFISQPDGDWQPSEQSDERPDQLYLDAAYEAILAPSYVVIQHGHFPSLAAGVQAVLTGPRTAYGISGKTTRLGLSEPWWNPASDSMDVLRSTTVYAQSEELSLAEIPYTPDVEGNRIELDDLYEGLQSGRWVMVSGERTDIKGTTGVLASEVAMVAGIEQSFDTKLPGDKTRTTLVLANKLAYRYQRATVTIYGNVVKATNGQTRNETLGNGDASQAFQQFALKQAPLTFVPASNPTGVNTTLAVYVNNVEWQETDTLAGLGPKDRSYITQTADDDSTSVIFGNGVEGARLPTGAGNVTAIYRNGIGQPGNVDANQISLLQSRPLNVKAVINPLRASGGADRDSRDQARRNAPLTVMSLDRLVSVQDYADFARTFAGIGKASSARLSDGQRDLVYVTVAGVADIPIDPTSDLYINLVQALLVNGDPYEPVQVAVRRLNILVIAANIKILADYLWEDVVTRLQATIFDAYSFDNRDLGQPVFQSEVISTMQSVAGVEYVTLLTLDSVPENVTAADLANLASTLKLKDCIPSALACLNPSPANYPTDAILAAELVYLNPALADTLILNEVKS